MSSTYRSFGTPQATQERSTSPVKTKIESLTTQLDTIQQSIAQDRTLKFRACEKELDVIQNQLLQVQENSKVTIEQLREEIDNVITRLEEAKANREDMDSQLTANLTALEDSLKQRVQNDAHAANQSISESLESAQGQLDDCEARVSQIIGEKTEQMKIDFESLLEKLPILQEQMKEEQDEEERCIQELEDTLRSEIDQLRDAIEEEQNLRKQMEEEASRTLEEFVQYAKEEIEAERRERLETEQALSNLWEQTCKKIEESKQF
ncbi:hypothetical protein BLNAU_12859 [Blattamonas nauphoetae]|uniref:Uncharacterized protein n=1 Tax=Blattamonas nauphoetae TaxID=2049346 RepID=A0ABQ9XJH6_9EUKA|nr:hypothetical protein BLNAU_12859 [Blattamonas nauphoetae]